MPSVVPLLTPLTARQETLHLIRNHLTFIAGTAYTLRRHAANGTLDADAAADRLERVERAAWQVDALLDQDEEN